VEGKGDGWRVRMRGREGIKEREEREAAQRLK